MTDDSPEEKDLYEDEQEFLSTHRIEKIWIEKCTAGRRDEISICRDLDSGKHWGLWYDDRPMRHYFILHETPLDEYFKTSKLAWITPEAAQKKRAQELELKRQSDERFSEIEKRFIETYSDELTQHRLLAKILLENNYDFSPITDKWARRLGIELWAGFEPYIFFD